MTRFHRKPEGLRTSKSPASYYSEPVWSGQPAVVKPDYIKWMLDDPFINFSIEPANDAACDGTGGKTGIAHVGLQAENPGRTASNL